jgi:peptide/nickel transport system ATP-binding protein
LADLVATHQMAALYITHDLAVVSSIADRVMVLYSGRIAEHAARDTLFDRPGHPYTSALLGAAPDIHDQHELTVIPGRAPSLNERRSSGCSFAPRCTWARLECEERTPALESIADGHVVACFRAAEVAAERVPRTARSSTGSTARETILQVRDLAVSYGPKQVLSSVSFDLERGECLALVGESGSGKTTLSRAIIGLSSTRSGDVVYRGRPLPVRSEAFPNDVRQKLQYVFQSPYRSLNPRRTVGASLATAVKQFFDERGNARDRRIDEALERVSLTSRVKTLYPDQLSGGERQRVAIARALVCKPEVLLCDEVTSALDVSVQAQIVQLLADLREAEGLTLLFVTHNLALVRSIADRVMVLNGGVVAESGLTTDVLDNPSDEYTRSLVRDTPALHVTAPDRTDRPDHERNIAHGIA